MVMPSGLGRRAIQMPVLMVSSSGWAATMRTRSGSITAHHFCTEIGKLFDALRRAGVMRLDATALGRETERYGDVEIVQRLHLTVEPLLGVGAMRVGPAQAGTHVGYAEPPQPRRNVFEPRILEMNPLTDAHFGRVFREMFGGEFGRAVLMKQAHVEMAIVGRALRLAMTRRGRPGAR